MAQGWTPNSVADTVTFYEPPGAGVAISITQNPFGGTGGSDVWALGAWSPLYGYPREIEFYSDRLFLASTPKDPQNIWGSCIGDYTNFGRSSPIVDSDAVTFAINSRQVNTIVELIPLDSLLIMTTGGEYKMTGGVDEVVSPSTIGVKNQGNSGSGGVPATVLFESAVFIQAEGQKVRDLGYQFEKDGFRGNEISIWGSHLFEGYIIQNVAYWKSPWSVLWFNRDDGIRVGCTYMPEQEVIGFHWHDTDGDYIDTCTLPGDPGEDSECYFLVRRVIDGQVVQYLEQQAPTRFESESDLHYVDAGLTYDGRNTSPSHFMQLATLSGGWLETDELQITSTSTIFVGPTDVGDAFALSITVVESQFDPVTGLDVDVDVTYSVRFFIDEVVDGFNAKGHSIGTVPTQLRNVPIVNWAFRRDTIGGLWHLEGEEVRVLQDAAVSGPYLVENGRISLQEPGGVVQVGLGYVCEVETLEINDPGGSPIRDSNKLTYAYKLLLLASRGVYAGGMKDKLYPVKERAFEDYGQPPFLKSGVVTAQIPSYWGEDAGRVRVVSTDPLPMEILSLTILSGVSGTTAANARAG